MTSQQEPLSPLQEQPEQGHLQDRSEAGPGQNEPDSRLQQEQPVEPELTLAQDLAELVRSRTREQAKLTPLAKLEMEGSLLDEQQQEELVAAVQADESCKDIEVLRTSSGALFLYSGQHMTGNYAHILLRAEDGNPYEQIAAPVREHSKIYPRATSLEELKDSVYGIDQERMLGFVDEMAQMDEYSDIKLITASTKALYLYSERHLTRSHAEFLVEYEEVGRYKNL